MTEKVDDVTEQCSSGTKRSECTIMGCPGVAKYGYWVPDLGQFSRVCEPDHDLLDDGDLSPYVCESCHKRMAASPHWEADRFVDPREKLVADGGETYECLGVYCTEKLPAPGTCSKECDETVDKSLLNRSLQPATDRSGVQ